ncbi:MAG: hypothetical protein HOL48_05625 [Porticoccaceae bacterium]|nr:hypothetical protein [Porticoccaceae bacterium]
MIAIFLLTCSSLTLAGGGYQPKWYELESNLRFDPLDRSWTERDSTYIFSQFFPREYTLSERRQLEAEAFQKDIAAAVQENRPSINFEDFNGPATIGAYSLNSVQGVSWGRCASASIESQLGFSLALIENSSYGDRNLWRLLTQRANLNSACRNREQLTRFIEGISQNLHTVHHRYLYAAALFYAHEYALAYPVFEDLSELNIAWVSEASSYMLSRTALAQSQLSAYYLLHRIDENTDITRAREAILLSEQYLTRYPEGLYTQSAKGLIRGTLWRLGEESASLDLLERDLNELLAELSIEANWSNFQQEKLRDYFDEVSLFGDKDRAQALSSVRAFISLAPNSEVLAPLRNFVESLNSFQLGDFAAVVAQYQGKENLAQPELVLLARAYEGNNQTEEALSLWLSQRMGDTLDYKSTNFEAAQILMQDQNVESLIRNELITDSNIRRVYLSSLCGDSLQKDLLQDTQIGEDARHDLFADLALRYIFHERLDELDSLIAASYSDSIVREFSSIREPVRLIASDDSAEFGYVELAHFLQTVVEDPIPETFTEVEPGCRNSTLANDAKGPNYYFNMAVSVAEKKSNAEAKALFYLTICPKYRASCMWGSVIEDGLSSREAFTKLHSEYEDTSWAKRAEYYY